MGESVLREETEQDNDHANHSRRIRTSAPTWSLQTWESGSVSVISTGVLPSTEDGCFSSSLNSSPFCVSVLQMSGFARDIYHMRFWSCSHIGQHLFTHAVFTPKSSKQARLCLSPGEKHQISSRISPVPPPPPPKHLSCVGAKVRSAVGGDALALLSFRRKQSLCWTCSQTLSTRFQIKDIYINQER